MVSEPVLTAADREFVALVDRWVDRMHDVSQNIVGSSAAAATICREVLESLWERREDLTDADVTGDALLLAARQRSLEYLEAHGWNPPGAGGPVDPTDPADEEVGSSYHDSAAVQYRVVLAHAAAAVLGAGNTSLVDLHDRHGVDAAALGAVGPLGLALLRAELGEALAAFTLWNGERPGCPALAAMLSDADGFDGAVFDAAVFDAVDRHRRTCEECAGEHRSLVNPAGLFLTARIATLAPPIRQTMLPFATLPGAGWTSTIALATLPAISADDVYAARRPGDDDEVAELWGSAATIAPAPRFVPVTPSRRRARPGTERLLVGGMAFLVVVAGGAVLAAVASDGGDRLIIDTPTDTGQPSDTGQPQPADKEEPQVRSLAPLPSTTETAATPVTATTTTSTPLSTSLAATEPTPVRPTAPATTARTQVATGQPPQPRATTPAPTAPATTAPATTPDTTTPDTTTPDTTTPDTTTPDTTAAAATTVAPTTTAATTAPSPTTG